MVRVSPFPVKAEPDSGSAVFESEAINVLQDLDTDRNNAKAYQFVLEQVLAGRITTQDQLDSFLNPRFLDGDLRLPGGALRILGLKGGGVVSESDIGTGKLNSEQVASCLELINNLKNLNLLRGETKGFDFVLEQVVAGRITTQDQLNSFLNPRFLDGDLRLPGGALRILGLKGGGVVSQQELGSGRLRQSDIVELEIIISELKNLDELINESKGFNFVLERVLAGRITTQDQLDSFLNPRFYDGDLRLPGGALRILGLKGRDTVSQQELGSGKISQEAQKVLLPIVNNPELPDEFTQNLSQFLNTGDFNSLEQAGLMNSGLNKEFTALVNYTRRMKLRQEICQGIIEDKDPETLCARLNEFEKKSAEDIVVVKDLLKTIVAKRKRNALARASKALEKDPRDFDTALVEAEALLKSKDGGEKELGCSLARRIYRLEIAELEQEVAKQIKDGAGQKAIDELLNQRPIRPSVEGFDYFSALLDIRNNLVPKLIKQRNIVEASKIRESLDDPVEEVVSRIDDFSEQVPETLAIRRQLTQFYKSRLAAQAGVYEEQVAPILERIREQAIEESFIRPELGQNKQAMELVRANFFDVIYPLVASLKADPATSARMKEVLGKDAVIKFTQKLIRLEQQRELTDNERAYIKSIEELTRFNPYLVACAVVNPSLTIEFLKQHFEKISAETASSIQDGDYIPAVGVGLGPNGIAALGEIVRNNATLAQSTLIVDDGKQPGGPFAVPEGPAWELNSANGRGGGERIMPAKLGANELETVRAYGSPVTRWYPGERVAGRDTRSGSINTTVDWLPSPDDISNNRYPTNEELALILSLQTAIMTQNVCLESKIVALRKNPDEESQGDKIVTLELKEASGETRRVDVRTDAVYTTTGLGEAGYGFDIEGTRAQKIIEDSTDLELPKIIKTLDGFRTFASREKRAKELGKTLVIWGGGNSADTLLEYIGNLFKGDNPYVRNIEKVYVITEKDLSSRPRYSQLNDLRPRNGKGNFIETVKDRVTDVDYVSTDVDIKDRELQFLNASGDAIRTEDGELVKSDFAIAATGFKSRLDELFAGYVAELDGDTEDIRTPLTLPTNPSVAVAETLKVDPNVLILGTASAPRFTNLAKLDQLPREAREALLRNGAENAVAIGFRAPDTQAAMNIWINSRDIQLGEPEKEEEELITVDSEDGINANEEIDIVSSEDGITQLPRNINDERDVLSPVFNYLLRSGRFQTSSGEDFSGELRFKLKSDDSANSLKLVSENDRSLSREFVNKVKLACEDRDFQKYCRSSLKRKRRNPSIDIVLRYRNGKLAPKYSFIQV